MLIAIALAAHALAPGARPVQAARAGAARCSPARMGFFDRLLEEVDNFADDVSMRRLGNGAKFYGKRKSRFYGEGDAMRKRDPRAANEAEDYSGPGGGSFFVLSKERDAKGRPLGFLTRKEAREQERAEAERKWEAAGRAEQMAADFARAIGRDDDEG